MGIVGSNLILPLHAISRFAAAFVLADGLSAAVQPDANAARALAAQLQIEFQTKKSAAFIERFDETAFHERLFGTRDFKVTYPKVPISESGSVAKLLAALDAYPYFAQFRVVLDDDVRTLDFDFLNEPSAFKTVRFFLVQNEAGEIHISDFHMGGEAMPRSQFVRHAYILQGIAIFPLRDEEERQLAAFSRQHSSTFTRMMTLMNTGDIEGAFRVLQSLPPDVARTRVCRHYLTCQIGFSTEALEVLRIALRDEPGQFDPIYRFQFAVNADDRATALAAVDEVLESHQWPSLYQCLKAELLLNEGRAQEAYALAHETMMLEPCGNMAYLSALRSAVTLNCAPDAWEVLTEWSRVMQPSDIDTLLSRFSELRGFCSSPEYSVWKDQSLVPPSVPPAHSP